MLSVVYSSTSNAIETILRESEVLPNLVHVEILTPILVVFARDKEDQGCL